MDAGNYKHYEERIAALEEKISQFQAQMEREATLHAEFSLKNWLERYGLLLAWGLLILLIGAFKPDAMFSWNSYAVMFGSQAMLVVLALAFIVPLTAGDFDLSIAGTMALSSMLVAVLNTQADLAIFPTVLTVVAVGAVVGVVNAFFILYFRIHSLIVTLGTGYFISGLVFWVSDSNTIAGVSMDLINAVILWKILGVPLSFYYAAILAIIIWYVFEYTSIGRRLLFVGRGREVARLSGVDVVQIRAWALVTSGVIAAIAGVLYTGMRGAADPTSALTFLLPAIAAAYLGSTSIYPGRFNAPGACIAVFFLSTGIMGLNFLGADTFVQNLFYGGGLVIAVSISQLLRNRQQMD